jgi:mannose-6-phosphate isomerase-like protein (cupin superfamily)
MPLRAPPRTRIFILRDRQPRGNCLNDQSCGNGRVAVNNAKRGVSRYLEGVLCNLTSKATVSPINQQPGQGEALWAFGTLATIKAFAEMTDGKVCVIEHLAPQGVGSPLHVHHREDEWFYVIEGKLTFWVDGRTIEAAAGSFVYGPRDVPHTSQARCCQTWRFRSVRARVVRTGTRTHHPACGRNDATARPHGRGRR